MLSENTVISEMTLGLSGIIIRLSANVPQHFTNRSVKCEKYMPSRVIIVTFFLMKCLKEIKMNYL